MIDATQEAAGVGSACSVNTTIAAIVLSVSLSPSRKCWAEGSVGSETDGSHDADEAPFDKLLEEDPGAAAASVLGLVDPRMDGEVSGAISDAIYALARLRELCIERSQVTTKLSGAGGLGGAETSVMLAEDASQAGRSLRREVQKRLTSAGVRFENGLKRNNDTVVH